MNSAREQDSSIGGGASNVCLGVLHMEEEVQDRVQVEVGREEQGEGETHGKEQCDEQEKRRENNQPLNIDGMRMGVTRACRHLSLCGVIHIIKHVRCAREKVTCEVYLCTPPPSVTVDRHRL